MGLSITYWRVMLVRGVGTELVEVTVKVKVVVALLETEQPRSKIWAEDEEVVSMPTIETKVETPPERLKLVRETEDVAGVVLLMLKLPDNTMLLMTMLTLSAA